MTKTNMTTQEENIAKGISELEATSIKKRKGIINEKSVSDSIFLGTYADSIGDNGLRNVRLLNHLDNLPQLTRKGEIFVISVVSDNPNSIHFNDSLETSSQDGRSISENLESDYKINRSHFVPYGITVREDEKFVYVNKYEVGVQIKTLIANGINIEQKFEEKVYNNLTTIQETFELCKQNINPFNTSDANLEKLFDILSSYQKQEGFVSRFYKRDKFKEKEFLNSLTNIVFVKESDAIISTDFNDKRYDFFNPYSIITPFELGTVVQSSVGKTRQGDARYIKTFSETNDILEIPEFYKRINYKPEAFSVPLISSEKLSSPKRRMKTNIQKSNTRARLNSSSSLDIPLFDNNGEYVVTYYDKQTQIPVYDSKGNITGHQFDKETIKRITFDSGLVMDIAPDFYVYQTVTIFVTKFYFNREIGTDLITTTIKRNATDGAVYFSERIKEKLDKTIGQSYGGYQFRMFGNQKGLATYYPGLYEETGADILSFEGTRKSDIMPFLDDKDLTFSIINFTYEPKVVEASRLARQALINIIRNPKISDVVFDISSNFWKDILEFDIDKLLAMLGVSEVDLDNVENYEEILFNLANSQDSDTAQFISSNPDMFLKSGAMRTKVTNLIMSHMNDFSNGHAYLPDSYNRHMIVDPVGIMYYIKAGLFSVVKGQLDGLVFNGKQLREVGISENNVLDSGKDENGNYFFKEGDTLLVRFPNLDAKEIRKVSKNHFNDEYTKSIYNKGLKKGYFKGLVIFSLWDMNPEGMSGADFDGDQCLLINNIEIVNTFTNQELFLDYSLVEDKKGNFELIEGCPFPGDAQEINIYDIVTQEEQRETIKKFDIRIGGDKNSTVKYGEIEFNEEALLSENYDEFIKAIHPIMQYFILINLKGNGIGKYTDLLTSVSAIRTEVEGTMNAARYTINKIKELGDAEKAKGNDYSEHKRDFDETIRAYALLDKEHKGYLDLEIYLTAAVRWEIDAAKHGGAYKERLPFLKALDGINIINKRQEDITDELIVLENKFNISLQRMFIKREYID